MAANSSLQITELDFDSIKSSLKSFLQGQSTFQDYNFEGAGLSNLLDILAYNTHYNAYYLNMVANEMFLDTSQLRSSVISHAKLLNYMPKSAQAPSATINLMLMGAGNNAVTLPKHTQFQSAPINGTNYTFVTLDETTVNSSSNVATFSNLEIVQGQPLTYTFTYSALTNPSQTFKIPDPTMDTTTILVRVQTSSSNGSQSAYTLATDYFTLTGDSQVFFMQESLDVFYEIYFGDNVLGKSLTDGNLVIVDYLSTSGSSAAGANVFTLMDVISGTTGVTIQPVTPASTGRDKETISSIKFTAPKAYSAQQRAVSTDDYIALIMNNNLGYQFDSVSVWSGADNDPPNFGQVYIAVKPSGSYNLSATEKSRFITQVIKPASIITVVPTIVDPDYTYIKITSNVLYDQKKTTQTASQLQGLIKTAIQNFSDTTLNTFNSTFSIADLITTVQSVDPSIITNESSINVQKKIYPLSAVSRDYTLDFGTPLKRSMFNSGINSYPSFQIYDNTQQVTLYTDVFLEEVPFPTSGVDSINILNPGFGYQYVPKVVISGDGSGATAHAIIKNGSLYSVVVDTPGSNYTQAVASIVNDPADTSGVSAAVTVSLQGRYGTLRTYYFNNGVKTILNPNAGTIDYQLGIITITNFTPHDINDPLGQLVITATTESTIISSTKNKLLSVDPYDPNAITVSIQTK